MAKNTPFVLVVLDGWGIAPKGPGNAIEIASKPSFNSLLAGYPHTQLLASGEAVGLPAGEDGNSEVGHLNLGAGRIVYQDLARINMTIADGTFLKNQALNAVVESARKNNSKLHLMGLFGSSGVHSSKEHLYAILNLTSNLGFKNVFLHLFTDGRDSPPQEAGLLINELEEKLRKGESGKVATISGRYYAMDRDNRWDRVKKTYDSIVGGIGPQAASAIEAIEGSYQKKITDEFIEPVVITVGGQPVATIENNDSIIFFNFRADRARELTSALVIDSFTGFPRSKTVKVNMVTMTGYEKSLPVMVAFKPENIDLPLARIISEAGLRQLHVAETEKYPHVTYFFNGGKEDPFENEDRIMIPSQKVTTYDLRPEMSVLGITETLIQKLNMGIYDFVVVNYANADMVGHSGKLAETVRAVEVLDSCLGKLVNAVLSQNGSLIITADHGNAEEMLSPNTGAPDTEHSTNPVPLLIINKELSAKAGMVLRQGMLADVAPTILDMMGIEKPDTIRGVNLLTTD